MSNIEKAIELGYEVELSSEITGGEKFYRVKGWGIDTIYSDKENSDEWKFLVTPEAHEHRVKMAKHNDPEDEFTMDEGAIFESTLSASLGAGLIDEDEAKAMRERHSESFAAH